MYVEFSDKEAADWVDGMQKEVERLRAELAFATQERNAYQDAVDVACEERDRLRAERDSQQRVCITVMAELAAWFVYCATEGEWHTNKK